MLQQRIKRLKKRKMICIVIQQMCMQNLSCIVYKEIVLKLIFFTIATNIKAYNLEKYTAPYCIVIHKEMCATLQLTGP